MAKELRNFQKASVDRICRYFFEGSNNNRYLLADEVGLGKTLVAGEVIKRFTEKYPSGSSVFYVCGNLTLIRQNEKKLKNGYEDYGSFWKKEAKNPDMSRLSLAFVKNNYLKQFNKLLRVNKTVALIMYNTNPCGYSEETFYKKDGNLKSENKWIDFLRNIYRQYMSIVNSYLDTLEKTNENYKLLLDLYNRLKEEKPKLTDTVRNNLVEIKKEIENLTYSPDEEFYARLSDAEKETFHENEWDIVECCECMAEEYDKLLDIPNVDFKSITPKTSIESGSYGTWIERAAVGVVFYKWKAASENNKFSFLEDEFNRIIKGNAFADSVFAEIRADGTSDYFENYILKVIKDEKLQRNDVSDSRLQMCSFLQEYITKENADDIMKKVMDELEGYDKEDCAENMFMRIKMHMAIHSLSGSGNSEGGMAALVVVDEFQNYSGLFSDKEGEYSIVNYELLQRKRNNIYTLMLSATPFHYSNTNVSGYGGEQADSGLEQIDCEIKSILEYIMESKYNVWNQYCRMRKERLLNGEFQNAIKCTRCIERLMYSNGISRVERSEYRIEGRNLSLSYEADKKILEDDLNHFYHFESNYGKIGQLLDGDIIIIFSDSAMETLIYRNEKLYLPDNDLIIRIAELTSEDVNCYEEADYDNDSSGRNVMLIKYNECEEGYGLYDDIDAARKSEIMSSIAKPRIPVSYLKDTPWLLSFADKYRNIRNYYMDDALIICKKDIKKYNKPVTPNARFNKLSDVLLGNDEQPVYKLLFIPPSKPDYRLWGIYEQFDNISCKKPVYLSKSLIFSENLHTPRAFTAMLSYESERRNYEAMPDSEKEKRNNHNNSTQDGSYYGIRKYDLSGNCFKDKKSESDNKQLIEQELTRYKEMTVTKGYMEYAGALQDNGNSPDDEAVFVLGSVAGYFVDFARRCNIDLDAKRSMEQDIEEIVKMIYSVFTTAEAYSIINSMEDSGKCYLNKIHKYCAQGNFRAVLDEYVHMIIEEEIREDITNEDSFQKLLKCLKEDYFPVIESYMTRPNSFRIEVPDFSEGNGAVFPIYSGFAQGISSESEKGDNQNALADKLLCFNSPFRPFVFTTTSIGAEGLDFHWFCRNIFHWALEMNPEKFQQKEGRVNRFHCHYIRQNLGKDYPDESWDNIYRKAGEECENKLFYPDWIYTGKYDSITYSGLTRSTCYYPESCEDIEFTRMLKNVDIYRAVLGESSLYDESRFEGITDEQKKELYVNLNPLTKPLC